MFYLPELYIGSFCIKIFNVGSLFNTVFIFSIFFNFIFSGKLVAIPGYQYFSSDDCSNDSSRDPDFICSESEDESFFSSDTDDEKDLFRQRKRKLCPRYVDDQDLNEAK